MAIRGCQRCSLLIPRGPICRFCLTELGGGRLMFTAPEQLGEFIRHAYPVSRLEALGRHLRMVIKAA